VLVLLIIIENYNILVVFLLCIASGIRDYTKVRPV